jgi:8-oxo-dGTP pyrophosphatase MutT (NUDIX family)
MQEQKHFNVTVYVMNENKEFLFIKHKKLNKWLAPGGHIDQNENPEDAAIREVKEETGLDITLIGDRLPTENDLIRPCGIQHNIITQNEHEHFDLIYLAKTDNSEVVLNDHETNGINWFSLDEINKDSFDSFEKNKLWCNFFYKNS